MAVRFNENLPIAGSAFNFYDMVSMRRMQDSKSVAKTGENINLTTSLADVWSGGTAFFTLL